MTFNVTDEELSNIEEWDKTHDCIYKPKHGMEKYSGAIGGRLTYEFIPTSIGVIGTVKCGCGKEYVFSDI